MKVLLAGLAFWLFSAILIVRLLRIGNESAQATRAHKIVFFLLVIAGAAMLFRPHEDLFGGQDGGAYLNFGARLARVPHLFYQDPLLARVPPPARDDFLYYGPGRPYLSKFACGQLKDYDEAVCGVWFQPAYPIVMSIAARLGSPRLVLFVVPLFTLFAGLALRALAGQVFARRGSGTLAFVFYIASPLVVWHGRHARPEVIASFLLFGGAALILNAWRGRRWERWADLLLGAAAISIAPLFHITAWMVTLPAAVIIVVIILSGRDDFLPYPLIQLAGFLLFARQLVRVNDTYHIWRFLAPAFSRPGWLTLALAAGFVILASAGIAFRRRRGDEAARGRLLLPAIGWVAGLLTVAAYLTCYVLVLRAPPEFGADPVFHYAYRTDVRAVLNMLSLPLALLALAGLVLFAARKGEGQAARIAVLVFAVPATLLIGNFYDFFITRYMLVAMMPLVALGLAALVDLVPDTRKESRAAAIALSIVILGVAVHGRTHLIRVVEFRGLYRALSSMAQTVREQNGILLFEYPRLAAPFDHMFGVPTLALHNERDDDYQRAEAAWDSIVRECTNRPAFYITPFQNPFSDRFAFVPIREKWYWGKTLVQSAWDLPTKVADWGVNLRLFRMISRSAPLTDVPDQTFPCIAELDDGNMGLRRFANTQRRDWNIDGLALAPGEPVTLPVMADAQGGLGRDLLLFLMQDHAKPAPVVTVAVGDQPIAAEMTHLVNDWWMGRVRLGGKPIPGKLMLNSETATFLAGAQLVWDESFRGLPLHGASVALESRASQAFNARWARDGSEFCVPIPEDGYVVLFGTAPEELPGRVRLVLGANGRWRGQVIPTGQWMWCAWPVRSLKQPAGPQWLTVLSSRPFDPQVNGFPPDLAWFMGYYGVVR